MFLRNLEGWHLIVVLLLVILVFGSRRLPDAARAVGKSMRILKSETAAMKTEDTPVAPPSLPAPPRDAAGTAAAGTAAAADDAAARPAPEPRSQPAP